MPFIRSWSWFVVRAMGWASYRLGLLLWAGGPQDLVHVLDDLRVDDGAGARAVDEVLVTEHLYRDLEVGNEVGQVVSQLLDILEQDLG